MEVEDLSGGYMEVRNVKQDQQYTWFILYTFNVFAYLKTNVQERNSADSMGKRILQGTWHIHERLK